MSTPTADDLADRIGQLAQAADIEVAVAESLTGGAISSRLTSNTRCSAFPTDTPS